jgi:hydroxyacylglutathione hydrolase
VLGDLPDLDLAALRATIANGEAIAIDVRSTADFAAGHIPQTLNLPTGSSFATWAGSLIPYDRDIVILADDPRRVTKARHGLALIGLDRVAATASTALRESRQKKHGMLETVLQLNPAQLVANNHRRVFDVRGTAEWKEGHLPNAEHLFLGDLAELARDIPRDTPIAVHCQGGTRSAIAASLLQAQGFTDVANVAGGIQAWKAAGLEVVRDD